MTRRNKQAEQLKKQEQLKQQKEKEPVKEKKKRKRTLSNPIPKDIQLILSQLKVIRDKHEEISLKFSDIYDYRLNLEDGKVVPERNKELYMFEEDMLKLMIKLDGISSDHLLVRETRRNIIVEIQQKLKVLDQFKMDPKSLELPERPKAVLKKKGNNIGILVALMAVLIAGLGYQWGK